jgi:hypothetical protein
MANPDAGMQSSVLAMEELAMVLQMVGEETQLGQKKGRVR